MDNHAANRWIFGALYVALALALVLFHILPANVGPKGYPGPDLLVCLTFVWVLRRPQYLPTPLIAAVFLMTDILFLRPPGLWTGLIVVSVEYLRTREAALRERPLMAELAVVSVTMIALHVVYALLLLIFGVAQAPVGAMLLQLISNLIAYPALVAMLRLVFKIQKLSPAEFDTARRAR